MPWHTGALGRAGGGLDIDQERTHLCEQGFGFSAKAGPGVSGLAGGRLRLITTFECVVERQTVVTIAYGLLGAGERARGGREGFAGKPVGAGRTGGIDGALGLIHLLVRRFGAASRKQCQADTDRQQIPGTHIRRV